MVCSAQLLLLAGQVAELPPHSLFVELLRPKEMVDIGAVVLSAH